MLFETIQQPGTLEIFTIRVFRLESVTCVSCRSSVGKSTHNYTIHCCIRIKGNHSTITFLIQKIFQAFGISLHTKATTNHTVIFQTTHTRNYVHFFLTYTGSCNRHTFHNLCFNRSTHYRRNFYRFSNLRFSQFLLFCFFICFFLSAFTRFTRRECQCNAQSHS